MELFFDIFINITCFILGALLWLRVISGLLEAIIYRGNSRLKVATLTMIFVGWVGLGISIVAYRVITAVSNLT